MLTLLHNSILKLSSNLYPFLLIENAARSEFTLTGSPNEWPAIPSIGHPIANTQIYLLDDQLQPVPFGASGELYIGGVCLARGYINHPKLTEERFILNPFSYQLNERLYKTGDSARYLPNGNLEFLGRIDQQVKIRGFRIEPGEVEALMEQHPMIQEAVVTAREDVLGDKRLVGYVISNLLPERIPYQFDCIVEFDESKIKLRTKDISASGICLVGVPSNLTEGMNTRLYLRFPIGFEEFSLQGSVAWRDGEQAGIRFHLASSEEMLLQQSLEYLFEAQGLLNTVQRTFIGNLRNYLKQKLPEYMIPSNFVMMKSFPLTPSGKVDRRALPVPERSRPELEVEFVSARSVLEAKIGHLWKEVLDLEKVGIHDNFFDLGGHSIQAVELVTKLQSAFQIKLSLHNFLTTPSIAGLTKLIEAQQLEVSPLVSTSSPSVFKLTDELVLDAEIDPKAAVIQATGELANIFLTGATGFLGAFILYELLEKTQANICCLVRAENFQQANQRLQRNLEQYSLWDRIRSSRIIPIIGDLARPKFGLSPEKFQDLAETIDAIYHNGCLVNFIYPYSILKAPNVLGTQEVLRLACQTKIKPVNFVSSIDIISPISHHESATIQEKEAVFTENLFGYAQSKWVAEQLVTIANERGLPTTIYRPSWIEGHSETGISNSSDFLRSLIKSCVQMKLVPDWKMRLDIVPVDYVSQAIVHLSRQHNSSGKVFHLTNSQSISWLELAKWMRTYGYSLQTVSHEH
ncbi:MAG: D-alanine--D-alanyl carrier protein ligase [Chroococcidiopsis sp. SAG 2025]|nr:D-alanine--D-alanyl carrier protein ligase [Chroococcidiopsis sp. SAG 2025]